jgi:squalene monooxygenase
MLEHVMPQLPNQIQPSFKAAISEQRLRVMPNSILSAVLNSRKGLIVVGDALNMRHPLTGG